MEKLQEAAPGVFLVEDTCNVYLIRAADAAIAVDFGSGLALDRLQSIGVHRIEWILHTHFHRDCCQGDRLALERGTRIAVPAAESTFFEQAGRFWRNAPIFPHHGLYSDFRRPTYDIPVHRALHDGDVFRWRGIEIRVLETPGHTRGSISYLVEIAGVRVAFSGDLIFAPGKVMTYYDMHWNYLTPILSGRPDGSIVEMGMDQGFKPQLESLQKLLRQNLDILLPAHGKPIHSPAHAIVKLSDRIAKTYDVLLRRTVNLREPIPQRILPSLIYLGNTSFGVVGGTGKLFLIDYSYGNDDMIQQARSKFGFGRIDVAYPTHYHPDHGGFKELLDKESFEVWADQHVADVLENPRSYKLPGLCPHPTEVTRVLGEMEEFEWDGHRFISFHFPCHTYYAAGLLAEIDGKRVLFSGDNVNLVRGRKLQGSFVPANVASIRKGYIPSAAKMAAMRPDIIMASHSRGAPYEVNERMLASYYEWAKSMELALIDLIGLPDYEWGIDPNWVSIHPYLSDARRTQPVSLDVSVTNHLAHPAAARLQLIPPEGWAPAGDDGTLRIPGRGNQHATFTLTPGADCPAGRYIATVRAEFDGRDWGEVAECILDLH